MKKILLGLLIITGINGFSQNLIDANGDVVATLDSTGILLDATNVQMGAFAANGDVTDMGGSVLGNITNNEFRDGSGALLGTIDANNNVFDVNNNQIGTVQAGLMVIDANNHVLGRASAVVDSKKLAAYFFFYFTLGI